MSAVPDIQVQRPVEEVNYAETQREKYARYFVDLADAVGSSCFV